MPDTTFERRMPTTTVAREDHDVENLDLYGDLSTATISDALDRLGLPGSCLGLMPLWGVRRMVGPAFTVRYVPVGSDPGTVGDYLDDVPPGSVVVLDNYSRTDCTVWGDILSSAATSKGIAGTVISGVCRDTARPEELRYPIYSLGRFMRTGKGRVEVAEVGGSVVLGGVRVCPGDMVVGDLDGVVVVPSEFTSEVYAVAKSIDSSEDLIRSEVQSGVSVGEARRRHGYHTLQSSREGELE